MSDSRPSTPIPGDRATQTVSYTRSLLKIQAPIVVSLAKTRLPVSRIVELGPGAIIQLDKSCDEPLTLEVGGRPVALGETVKVGEKFGLKVTQMILPEERFVPLHGVENAPRQRLATDKEMH